jgi:xanthine dehydrogenase YagT iron-sulfur-binding subunit
MVSPPLTPGEIRERMSGNLCRCGAYVNIVRAISAVAEAP